jgi:hypothetical protein
MKFSDDVEIGESKAEISLLEERRKWANGMDAHTRNWFMTMPDEEFCRRVEAITGVSPLATAAERDAHANRKLQEALDHVKAFRETKAVGGKIVTLSEVMAIYPEDSSEHRYWSRPTQQEGLKIVLAWQVSDGFDWSHELSSEEKQRRGAQKVSLTIGSAAQ